MGMTKDTMRAVVRAGDGPLVLKLGPGESLTDQDARHLAVLRAMGQMGTMSGTASRSGIGRATLYRWVARFPDLAEVLDEAAKIGRVRAPRNRGLDAQPQPEPTIVSTTVSDGR